MNLVPLEIVKSLMQVPSAVQSVENFSPNVLETEVYTIAGVTRSIMYKYATIGSTGNVSFHVLSPFHFNDQSQDIQYRKKTVWVGVARDTQKGEMKGKPHFYNSNLGNLNLVLRPRINNSPNIYNSLLLMSARIKNALAPATVLQTAESLKTINEPCDDLHAQLQQIAAQDLDKAEINELTLLAWNTYSERVIKLFEEGILQYTSTLINPKPDSIRPGVVLDETQGSDSSDFLNMKKVAAAGVPLSTVPTLNQFRGVVKVLQDATIDSLYSDNERMLEDRVVYRDDSTGRQRQATTVVALLKDYNSDTMILTSLVDASNATTSTNPNYRGRVDTFKELLTEKNQDTFYIEGSLSPVIRTKNDNSARDGNILFELKIDEYRVHQSTSSRASLDFDAFGSLDAESFTSAALEPSDAPLEDSAASDMLADTLVLDDLAVTKPTKGESKSKGKGKDDTPPAMI